MACWLMLAKAEIQTGDKRSVMTACISVQMHSFAKSIKMYGGCVQLPVNSDADAEAEHC